MLYSRVQMQFFSQVVKITEKLHELPDNHNKHNTYILYGSIHNIHTIMHNPNHTSETFEFDFIPPSEELVNQLQVICDNYEIPITNTGNITHYC